jgi:hypothetical protein
VIRCFAAKILVLVLDLRGGVDTISQTGPKHPSGFSRIGLNCKRQIKIEDEEDDEHEDDLAIGWLRVLPSVKVRAGRQ